MTIHVTVHHVHGESAPQQWEVQVLRPPKGKVVGNEPQPDGHVLEFEVANNTRELSYQWWEAGTKAPTDLEPVTFALEAGSDEQSFDVQHDDAGQGAGQGAERQGTDQQEQAVVLQGGPPGPGDDRQQGDRQQGDLQQAAATAGQDGGHYVDPAALEALQQRVDEQFGSLWDTVGDLAARVEQLEAGPLYSAPQAPGPETPIPETPIPETPQPTGVEAAVLGAAAATVRVRDGFAGARDTFAADVGLEVTAGGGTVAGSTIAQLRLAISAADRAIDRYETLATDSTLRAQLDVESFTGEVQRAGTFYADTVRRLALAAERAFDDGERLAYQRLLTALREDQVSSAIEELRSFTVVGASAGAIGSQGSTGTTTAGSGTASTIGSSYREGARR
jgi:hypothetical protein